MEIEYIYADNNWYSFQLTIFFLYLDNGFVENSDNPVNKYW